MALGIRQRLLASHMFAVVVIAGPFGVFVYWMAAQVVDAAHRDALRLYAALAFLVCVLAALLLSRILAGRILMRINDLTARCRALASGDALPPRRPGPRDEFDNLSREFDAMAGRLRHTAQDRERAHAAVRDANARLESRVRERTAELESATVQLKKEIESRVHVETLLAEAAMTDGLTGLLNRRAMLEMLEQAAARLKPGETGLSVIIIDIDHFKRVNDEHGHDAGDRVLAAVASRLRELGGDPQYVSRWGGEEFLILLPDVRMAAACQRAEAVRRDVARLHVDGGNLQVTLSLGVAELAPGEALDDCLRRCDQALYRAKDAGRNTVVAAHGTTFATMS
ncbi:MAG: diguanylate cyclase [Proteobacteria bacterium]|nr:diguanylate cyclase [Pseudomonadota bacterium]